MDNALCVGCGVRRAEHMHHVIYRSRGGTDTVDNTAPLCSRCHVAVHAKRLRLVKTDTGWQRENAR